MGDSENAQQPSKKRAALKELSRDNPGLDDEDDSSAFESATFKTASEEVLASRRIVRVKRRDPSAAAAAPVSNPFAGICLVAPPAPATTAAETNKTLPDATKETDGDKKEVTDTEGKKEEQDNVRSDTTKEIDNGEKDKSEAENKIKDETKATTETKETEKAKDDNDKGTDCVDKDLGGDQAVKEEKEGNGTEKNGDSGALSSFQQLSSSKNAFTGLASTGFSTSSFSFGLFSQQGSTGSGSGSLNEQSSFSFGNGNASLFGTSGSASITTKITDTTTTVFPSKQEVSVETGEENEKTAFTADSVMFEYLEGGWKERGKGELKVNISSVTGKARLVMRSKGNYRLVLNALLYPEMKLASMDKKGVTFACVNSVSEAKNGLSTFALKFKDPAVVEEFRAVIEQHKKSKLAVVETASSLKTPENSPGAEDA